MKIVKLIFFLFIIFLFTTCKSERTDWSCVYKNTSKKIESSFPFNVADKIEIVSYVNDIDSVTHIPTIIDTLIQDGKFAEEIGERVTLTQFDKELLFSFLYDYQPKHITSIRSGNDCGYTPRNAIVFYENQKAIAYIEICFDCELARASADFGDFCTETYCKLHNFFKVRGIKKGIHFDGMCQGIE